MGMHNNEYTPHFATDTMNLDMMDLSVLKSNLSRTCLVMVDE